jgi:hypothetical protein
MGYISAILTRFNYLPLLLYIICIIKEFRIIKWPDPHTFSRMFGIRGIVIAVLRKSDYFSLFLCVNIHYTYLFKLVSHL